MNKILLSPEAQNDLREIRRYISEELENPVAAGNTLAQIIKRMRGLLIFPESGSQLATIVGIETDYRYLVCGSYLVFYRTQEDVVFVDRVLYGKRDYLSLLFSILPEDEN